MLDLIKVAIQWSLKNVHALLIVQYSRKMHFFFNIYVQFSCIRKIIRFWASFLSMFSYSSLCADVCAWLNNPFINPRWKKLGTKQCRIDTWNFHNTWERHTTSNQHGNRISSPTVAWRIEPGALTIRPRRPINLMVS